MSGGYAGRLGHLQSLVLGLCAIHDNQTIAKLAAELERSEGQIARVVTSLEQKGLLREMRPVSRVASHCFDRRF